MAVYIVHASLLLIFLGGIVDALYGWRGFLMLSPGGQQSGRTARTERTHHCPSRSAATAAGEETYADGTPKKWWSKLAVVENGKEVSRKEIVVNDPLVYHGVRFYQASYGRTGKARQADSDCDRRQRHSAHAAGNLPGPERDRRARCRHERSTGGVHSRLRGAGRPGLRPRQRRRESRRTSGRTSKKANKQRRTSGCRQFPASKRTRLPPTFSKRKI